MREQVTSDQLQGAPDRQIVSLRHGRLAVRANIQQELRGPQATESLLRFAKLVARGADLSDRRCFRRAPGPAPFSSINSTPAFSRALRMAGALASVIAVFPSTDSARWIVARLTPDSRTPTSGRLWILHAQLLPAALPPWLNNNSTVRKASDQM